MSVTPGILASVIARISIAILLIRIFGGKTWLKWFLIIVTVLQAVSNLMIMITSLLQVTPIEGVWNPLIPAHRRTHPNIIAYMGYVGGCKSPIKDNP